MAVPQHVKILEEGPDAWNHWRIHNPDIRPDLSGADFSGASLVYDQAPMREGHSFGAKLVRNLVGVDLQGVNFYDSNLRGVLLRGTNL